MKKQMTTQQTLAAETLSTAWNTASNKWKDATQAERKAMDKAIDDALTAYRKAHNLSNAMGSLDIINHHTANHCA